MSPTAPDRLRGLPKFSARAMDLHWGLYEGYATAVKDLEQLLEDDRMDPRVTAEVQRRLGWERNGQWLHERFFETLHPDPPSLEDQDDLVAVLEDGFPSIQAYRDDLLEVASARGIGWTLTVLDCEGHVRNTWVEEHATGVLADARILLAVDVFEHAYLLDFGSSRDDYLDALWNVIDWSVVADRALEGIPERPSISFSLTH